MLLRHSLGLLIGLLGAVSSHAEASGSFLEGARIASLVNGQVTSSQAPRESGAGRSAKEARHAPDPRGQDGGGITPASYSVPAPGANTSPAAAVTAAPDDDLSAPLDLRSLLTMVVGLALVGWLLQRRRPDDA